MLLDAAAGVVAAVDDVVELVSVATTSCSAGPRCDNNSDISAIS